MPTTSSSGADAEPSRTAGPETLNGLKSRIEELERQVRELSVTELRYRELVSRSSEGIWRCECDIPIPLNLPIDRQVELALQHVYVAECNDAMARMYGRTEARELVGLRLGDFFSAEDGSAMAYLRAFHESGFNIRDVELATVGLDGKPRWFLESVFGIVERGCLVRAWGSKRDITADRLAQREIDFQKQFLRDVIESIPSVVFVKDDEGRYVLGNAATARLYGTEVETLEGRFDVDFRAAEESEQFLTVDRKVLETNHDVGPYEMKLEGADGKSYWFQATKHPIPSSQPGKRLVLGVCTDITDRKNSEIELLKIRHALDSAGDAITITDMEGATSYANPAFERMFGYDAKALNASGGSTALYRDDEQRDAVVTAMNDQDFYEGDLLLRHRDGSFRLVSQRIDVIRSPDGERIGVVGVRTDIGEHKRMESQLRQSEKLAALGELVAGVAHEVNNPLAAISINAQILKRMNDSAVQKRADTILRMVDRASRIGNSLLSFARASDNRKRSQPVNEVLRAAIELCEPSIRQAGASLTVEFCPTDPMIFVDESQIEQIVLNLVSNSLHAMRLSPVKILTICSRTERDWAVILLRDTGPGIPPENRERVFEPFFTTKPVGEGTGLGLSICHGIAEAHHGSLTFETSPGEGTAFSLRLPLRIDD